MTKPDVSAPELPHYADWPRIESSIKTDPAIEARIAGIVAGMTLEQKVGQMTQPDIRSISPEEVRKHYIGSVLNGGGGWPGNNKQATVGDWVATADAFWEASITTDAKVQIPIIWGTDAVHGHGNVFGATLFQHNIGLGATRDADLIERIAEATARQVWATGIDWTFAPTLAVVRDDRWGRTYEGYSEDAAIVREFAAPIVNGLQGNDFTRPVRVIGCAKHFLGDGGTRGGKDQGINDVSEAELINRHAQGYYTALAAGVQTVMATFNSWTNEKLGIREGKIHGSHYLLTTVLKGKMGFDGLVVSDWNGVGQVKGDTNFRCANSIKAGIDMVMVPTEWREFITNTLEQVRSGEIPMSRIDDAVTRILRVKLRAGVFELPRPAKREGAGQMKSMLFRDLAREAVRKSLVLLKNKGGVLPLARDKKVLVVGKAANDLGIQTAGWSLTWQGTTNTNADFPNADSILDGIIDSVGKKNVTFSEDAAGVDVSKFDAVIAIIGETPYAEGVGDLGEDGDLDHSARYPEDLAVIEAVSGKGVPVVTVLITGRVVWANRELNRSDAFVVAWLPGSEGKGVSDLLFRDKKGAVAHDFTGRLSYSWPKRAEQVALNVGDKKYDPLFAYGFGLSVKDTCTLGTLDETVSAKRHVRLPDVEIFRQVSKAPYRVYFGTPEEGVEHMIGADLNIEYEHPAAHMSTVQVNVQQDAKRIDWKGGKPATFIARAASALRQDGYVRSEGALAFDIVMNELPKGPVLVGIGNAAKGGACFDISGSLKTLKAGIKHTVMLPLASFDAAGADFTAIDIPFFIQSRHAFSAAIANIRWAPGLAKDGNCLKLG